LCDLIDKKIIKLFSFAFVLVCWTSHSGDIFNQLKHTLSSCGIDIFEATSKITLFKHEIKNFEEEIYINNLMSFWLDIAALYRYTAYFVLTLHLPIIMKFVLVQDFFSVQAASKLHHLIRK